MSNRLLQLGERVAAKLAGLLMPASTEPVRITTDAKNQDGATTRELSPEQIAREREQRAQPHRRAAMRAAVKDWTQRNPAATSARMALNRARRAGLVTAPARCQAVGCRSTDKLQAHHHDYHQPTDVAWLCPRHHRRLHCGNRIGSSRCCR
jgi:hypothetical protein